MGCHHPFVKTLHHLLGLIRFFCVASPGCCRIDSAHVSAGRLTGSQGPGQQEQAGWLRAGAGCRAGCEHARPDCGRRLHHLLLLLLSHLGGVRVRSLPSDTPASLCCVLRGRASARVGARLHIQTQGPQ